MIVIFFQPAGQISNIGDILINKSLLLLLRPYGKVIFNDTDRPRWFVDECIENGDLLMSDFPGKTINQIIIKFKKDFKEQDIAFYCFFPPGHTSRKGLVNACRRFYQILSLGRLKVQGCKVVRLGFSIGPFDFTNAIAESIVSSFYLTYGLREQESIRLAKRFFFRSIDYFPDLAWAFPVPEKRLDVPREYVVLSFRSNAYGTIHDPAYLLKTKEKLRASLQRTYSKNQPFHLVYQVGSDREGMLDLYHYLSLYFDCVTFTDKLMTLPEAGEIYANASLIISNRLHVLLYGMLFDTLGVAFIKESDNKKIIGIYQLNKLHDLLFDVASDESGFANDFDYVVKNREKFVEKFHRIRKLNQQEIEKKIYKLFNY